MSFKQYLRTDVTAGFGVAYIDKVRGAGLTAIVQTRTVAGTQNPSALLEPFAVGPASLANGDWKRSPVGSGRQVLDDPARERLCSLGYPNSQGPRTAA